MLMVLSIQETSNRYFDNPDERPHRYFDNPDERPHRGVFCLLKIK